MGAAAPPRAPAPRENTRLKPQLNHDVTIAITATKTTAERLLAGMPASRSMRRCTGAAVATTVPVITISAICMVKGMSDQKPLPQITAIPPGEAPPAVRPATTTTTVASSAKMKASGSHRSLSSVNRSATRSSGRGWSALLLMMMHRRHRPRRGPEPGLLHPCHHDAPLAGDALDPLGERQGRDLHRRPVSGACIRCSSPSFQMREPGVRHIEPRHRRSPRR